MTDEQAAPQEPEAINAEAEIAHEREEVKEEKRDRQAENAMIAMMNGLFAGPESFDPDTSIGELLRSEIRRSTMGMHGHIERRIVGDWQRIACSNFITSLDHSMTIQAGSRLYAYLQHVMEDEEETTKKDGWSPAEYRIILWPLPDGDDGPQAPEGDHPQYHYGNAAYIKQGEAHQLSDVPFDLRNQLEALQDNGVIEHYGFKTDHGELLVEFTPANGLTDTVRLPSLRDALFATYSGWLAGKSRLPNWLRSHDEDREIKSRKKANRQARKERPKPTCQCGRDHDSHES